MINCSNVYWEDVARAAASVPNLRNLYGKSVLITGGTGMICSGVADILLYLNREENAGIRIILAGRSKKRTEARFYRFTEGKDYEFFPYDATANVPVEIAADYFIHGASNANPSVYTEQPVETMLANITGLYSLLETASKSKAKRLLYVSSSEVYGNKEGNAAHVEDSYGTLDILNPRACYPSAKRAAETLCVSFAKEYGLETVIVRPGHIYGPTITSSDSRASAQFTRNAARKEDIVMKSAGLQLRSYCYTLDCASAILAVLLNGENGNAYNISNKDSVVTISALAKALAEAAGRKIVFENPSDLEKQGYNLMSNSSLNSEKLEALGWKAVFDLEEGTRKTVELFELD